MIQDLAEYREWFSGLTKSEQSAYINSLGQVKNPRRESQIRTLSREFLGKTITGCGYCLLSAHFELMKIDMKNLKEKTTEYALLPGVVLHDPVNKDFSKMLSPRNMTEELALYHIAHNPKVLTFFAHVPGDLDERLEKYVKENPTVVSDAREKSRLNVEALKKAFDEATEAAGKAKKVWDEANQVVSQLKAKLDEAKIDLDNLEDEGEAPAQTPVGDEGSASGETPAPSEASDPDEAPEGETEAGDTDPLVHEVKEFLDAGMTKANILESYAEEIESGKYTKSAIEKAYKAAKKLGGSEE